MFRGLSREQRMRRSRANHRKMRKYYKETSTEQLIKDSREVGIILKQKEQRQN